MKPEAQQITIAEACGIIICPRCFHEIDPTTCHCGDSMNHYPDGHNPVPMGCTCGYDNAAEMKAKSPSCPDYPNDLNACHEMEKLLTTEQYDNEYYFWLAFVIGGRRDNIQVWEYRKLSVHATAPQRCEAFLRTIDKWVE